MRNLDTIANEIRMDWKKPNYAAVPYIQAMTQLETVESSYGMDNGKGIVLRFLSNAGAWRGEKAREIKKELKEMVK